jgi:NADP-dependent 3-hydroxy acid dehydrogenase YdfG
MMRLKPVEEQVVVVMGASSGIGRETALRFAERGARVVVSARGEEGLDSLAGEIRREDGEATPVVADTSEYEQVKAVPTAPWRSTAGSTPGYTSPRWGSSLPSSRRLQKSSSES